jgi:uncharacterized protein YhbP (UPF0306 family)
MDTALLSFLQEQRLLTLATVSTDGFPWVSNVYYSITDKGEIFYISPTTTNHSKHVVANKEVAFSVAWYEKDNMENRKSVQGRGICSQVTNFAKISRLISNHLSFYPDWKDFLTTDAILRHLIESRPYMIKPTYMKFFNDELFGEEGTREFKF